MAANSASAADKKMPPHTFWSEMYKEVSGRMEALNVDAPVDILKILVENKVLAGYDSEQFTMQSLFGVYGAGLVNYSGTCKKEVFGKDGKYTDLICKMDRIRGILSKDKELPVPESSPLLPFQAAKPSVLADADKMARTYCEEFLSIPAKKCPKEAMDEIILPEIYALQSLVTTYVPGSYDNPLLSYGIGVSLPNLSGVTSNFLWGDGFFKMLDDIIYNNAFEFKCDNRLCLIEGFVLSFMINLYLVHNTKISNEEDHVYTILTGYLYHRQSKKIHQNRSARFVMTQVFASRHKCYYFTGVLIKEICGLGIDDTMKVIKQLNMSNLKPGGGCPIRQTQLGKANKFIRNGTKYKKSLGVEKCIKKLKK